jgi:undecaprenyl diphosphate synthase
MGLLERYLIDERAEIMEQGIRLTCIGDEGRLPSFVRKPLEALRQLSENNRQMTLCLALSYGGRESLVEASQRLAREVAEGRLRPEEIDASRFSQALSTASLPEVDLVIRTSGEQRLSNFLLWEAAQAELYFSPELWPDFDRRDLWEALLCYQRRERRLGQTSAQVAAAAARVA